MECLIQIWRGKIECLCVLPKIVCLDIQNDGPDYLPYFWSESEGEGTTKEYSCYEKPTFWNCLHLAFWITNYSTKVVITQGNRRYVGSHGGSKVQRSNHKPSRFPPTSS